MGLAGARGVHESSSASAGLCLQHRWLSCPLSMCAEWARLIQWTHDLNSCLPSARKSYLTSYIALSFTSFGSLPNVTSQVRFFLTLCPCPCLYPHDPTMIASRLSGCLPGAKLCLFYSLYYLLHLTHCLEQSLTHGWLLVDINFVRQWRMNG